MIVYRLSIVKLFNSYTDREKIQSNIQIYFVSKLLAIEFEKFIFRTSLNYDYNIIYKRFRDDEELKIQVN